MWWSRFLCEKAQRLSVRRWCFCHLKLVVVNINKKGAIHLVGSQSRPSLKLMFGSPKADADNVFSDLGGFYSDIRLNRYSSPVGGGRGVVGCYMGKWVGGRSGHEWLAPIVFWYLIPDLKLGGYDHLPFSFLILSLLLFFLFSFLSSFLFFFSHLPHPPLPPPQSSCIIATLDIVDKSNPDVNDGVFMSGWRPGGVAVHGQAASVEMACQSVWGVEEEEGSEAWCELSLSLYRQTPLILQSNKHTRSLLVSTQPLLVTPAAHFTQINLFPLRELLLSERESECIMMIVTREGEVGGWSPFLEHGFDGAGEIGVRDKWPPARLAFFLHVLVVVDGGACGSRAGAVGTACCCGVRAFKLQLSVWLSKLGHWFPFSSPRLLPASVSERATSEPVTRPAGAPAGVASTAANTSRHRPQHMGAQERHG